MTTLSGIILDGTTQVGKFLYFNESILFKLDLLSFYIDVVKGCSNRLLRYILVEESNNNIKIVEDFGMGIIHGHFILDNKLAYYNKASFTKEFKNLNNKLN